jgi:hypothetical protein
VTGSISRVIAVFGWEPQLQGKYVLDAAQQSTSVHRISVMNGIASADLEDLACWF